MEKYKHMSASEIDELAFKSATLLFDMRDPLSFECGHIPNAVLLNDRNIKAFLKSRHKDLNIIIYCYHGISSQDFATLFADFGFKNVYSLDGGYEGWLRFREEKMGMHTDLCVWLEDNGYSCKDLNKRSFNGETALMYAARLGNSEYVAEMIDRGADLEQKNNDGNTAVWLACFGGNEYVLELLIDAGADLNVQNDNGATPLIYSASAGKTNMIKKLVFAGADINLTTLDGFTAIDVASTVDVLHFLRLLAAPSVCSNEQTLRTSHA